VNDKATLRLLIGSIGFFVLCLFYAEHMFPNDGQVFQVISNLVSGFAGAFLMYIKGQLGVTDQPTGAKSITTTVTAKTETQETPSNAEQPGT